MEMNSPAPEIFELKEISYNYMDGIPALREINF